MAFAITVPRLGWSMEQGVFGGWLKPAGGTVAVGEPLFSLEGEKAVQEIEAVDAGVLHLPDDAPREGDVVAVGAVLGYLLTSGEAPPSRAAPTATPAASAPTPIAPATPVVPPAAAPSVRRLARQLGVDWERVAVPGRVSSHELQAKSAQPAAGRTLPSSQTAVRTTEVPPRGRGRPAISPRAARLAQSCGVDWTRLAGTGAGGRIREADVRQAAEHLSTAGATRGTVRIPATPLRQTIARRLSQSVAETVPVTLTTRADATQLVNLRRQFQTGGADVVPAYHDILAQLIAAALREHPRLNARRDGDDLLQSTAVHLGLAVDAPDGLLVPVIRDVDQRSLRDVARASRDLIERARTRRLAADELQGSTFTLSNLGGHEIDAFTPIINAPETAILGVGKIRRVPVVGDDDRIVVGAELTLSLTFDHRVVDGAPAARFLDTLVRFLAAPAVVLVP